MSTTPPEPAPAPAAADPLPERVGALEGEVHRQGGVLDEIKQMLTGRKEPVTSADPPAAGQADITEQVRQAVRDVNAEAAAAQPKAPAPEMTPREVGVRGKEKLQQFLFGGEPKK